MDDERFYYIDRLVGDSSHRYNPHAHRLEATIGSDMDPALDLHALLNAVDGITEEELAAYARRKAKEAGDDIRGDC